MNEDLSRRPKTGDLFNFQRALNIHEPNGPRAMRLPQMSSGKYQSTRYSQLSTFGLTFQICEMYEDKKSETLHSKLQGGYSFLFIRIVNMIGLTPIVHF